MCLPSLIPYSLVGHEWRDQLGERAAERQYKLGFNFTERHDLQSQINVGIMPQVV
jgi:hypothetical protein